ncbi:hypothetical protein AN641_00500 [Candidatus Epulonipiscioides gigas]|nr:hypothetical protein AN641_00500 [Epulopiscium sp. SCG-C07WGA-EpuloA2]
MKNNVLKKFNQAIQSFFKPKEKTHTINSSSSDIIQNTEEVTAENKFYSPIQGKLIPLSETPDEAFAQAMMGGGVAFIPTVGEVVAPCDGIINAIFPTKHAIGMTSAKGVELLIHVGLDTVNLQGKGFEAQVDEGQQIKTGDLLLKFDLEYIKQNVPSVITPMVFPDLEDSNIKVLQFGDVNKQDEIIELN